MKHPLIKVDEIPAQGTVVVPFFGREVHVYQVNGQPKAVANTCLHFGGPLECRDGKFICPWHGAEYDMQDGRRLKAPARTDARLMVLSTRVEDGVLNYVWGE
jgi:nitrite reductase/ring-hydroxylating ferredoxin subunit